MADFKVLDDDWYNFTSVSEAESTTYSQPCVVSVKDTGRVYQFDPASTATRDGIRYLTPAGGGRLLAIKTGSDDVEVPKIGTPDHQSLTQSLQVGLSAGACNGNFVTDAGGGAINIASGEGMIRVTNSSDSKIFAFRWPAVDTVAIPLNSVRYVGVEYNSGSPQAVVRTTDNWNGQTEFQAATVVNESGTLHILNNPQEACDGVQKIFHRLIETQPFQFAERLGGGRFYEVGTRNLTLSPCEFYDGLNEFPITAKNTSTGDTFDAYYGSFTKVATQTQWDNQNYDNAGTLTALSANRYGVHWLYIEMDDLFSLVYGQGNYNTISAAETAPPPASLPLRLSLGSRLAAKLIFQQGAGTVIQIESAFETKFQSGMPVSHSDLVNILGNGGYHQSEAERDAAIRIATASQSGLMSAAQVKQLSAYISATANPTANHDGVDTASVGRPFLIGQTWFNSESEILWQCVGNSTGAAKWIAVNLDLQEQERFAANVASFDYWRFYNYGNGRLTRDTTNGGMAYAFNGSAYAGTDGMGTQAVGIADQAVAVNVTVDQTDILLDVYCCDSYTLSLTTGSTSAVLYKDGKVTQIASATMGSALSTGTHDIMIVRRGNKLIGYLDGIKVVSATDTDNQGGDSRIEINVIADGSYTARINSYKLFQYQN